ncbi:MAG: hypothetical protein WCW33_02740 [Candidatus Babeliales bacterium]|jgi:hypothetical protein
MAHATHFRLSIFAIFMLGAPLYAMQDGETDYVHDLLLPEVDSDALRSSDSGSLLLPLSPLSPLEDSSTESTEDEESSPKRIRLNPNYFAETNPDKYVGFSAHYRFFQLKESPFKEFPRSDISEQHTLVYELMCIKEGAIVPCKKEVNFVFEIIENQLDIIVTCKDVDAANSIECSHEWVVIQQAPFDPLPTIIRKILAHELICIMMLDQCEQPRCCVCPHPICQLAGACLEISKTVLLKCNHMAHVACLKESISDGKIGTPFLCPVPDCQTMIASDDDYALT